VLVADQETTSWVPAFPSQRPPFAKGNELAATYHGAYSDRRLAPVVEQVLADVLDDPACEYLKAPRFSAELRSWAVNEARCRLLESYLAKLAAESGDELGDPTSERGRSAWALLHRSETRAQSGRDRLGLSPLSSARIGRDKAAAGIDVAMIMAQLHKLEQAGVDVLAGASQDGDGGDGG
jgi:hypothetical protein